MANSIGGSFVALLLAASVLIAQGERTIPVKVTEALNHQLRGSIQLTGSIESRRSSLVASDVEGVVEKVVAREGERVKRGQPLVRLRRTAMQLRLDAARGQFAEAEARERQAEARRERVQGLFEERVISQQQLDDAVADLQATRGRKAQLDAEVKRLEDELNRSTVRAPFTGVLVEEYVTEGEWIREGGTVAELVDTEDLEVAVDVPESAFAGVSLGDSVSVRLPALDDLEVEGRVRAVVPRADPQARTFPVKVSVPNPEGRIGVGMLARLGLPVGEPQPVVLVPKDAVVSQGTARVVFVVNQDNSVRSVTVRTGSSQGAWIAVEGMDGEIQAGDRVVTRGNERLFPGQTVNPELLTYEMP